MCSEFLLVRFAVGHKKILCTKSALFVNSWLNWLFSHILWLWTWENITHTQRIRIIEHFTQFWFPCFISFLTHSTKAQLWLYDRILMFRHRIYVEAGHGDCELTYAHAHTHNDVKVQFLKWWWFLSKVHLDISDQNFAVMWAFRSRRYHIVIWCGQ